MSVYRESNSVDLRICNHQSCGNKKKCQKNQLTEFTNAINGLYNSGGGILILHYNKLSKGEVKNIARQVEQRTHKILGIITLVFDINIDATDNGKIKTFVKTSTKFLKHSTRVSDRDMVITSYNTYLPSNEQVLEILPTEDVGKVRAIMMGNIVPDQPITKADSHHRDFVKGESVPFSESKTVQTKMLEDKQRKQSLFTTRLVGPSNRFACYVSAFANYVGGHIYIGIRDDGVVEGEHLTDEEKTNTKRKVDRMVKKMVWPEKSKPEEGSEDQRYQVYFEQVKDNENRVIPSLYVVVIFVAQCPGGVFTKEPESYEIVNHKAKKIDFVTWKKSLALHEGTPCDSVYITLTTLLNNNCNLKQQQQLNTESAKAQEQYKSSEVKFKVKLICLAKIVSYYLRRRNYLEANKVLDEYKNMLIFTTNPVQFKVLEKYLLCVMERGNGKFEDSYEIANKCFDDLKRLTPCLISVAFYVQIATLEQILGVKAGSRQELLSFMRKAKANYDRAKRQLHSIQWHDATKAEFKQKIYIYKALLYLGSSITGEMLADTDELIDIEKAEQLLSKTQELHKNNSLSKFREVQRCFAEACLSYRLAIRTSDPSKKTERFQIAKDNANNAYALAEKCNFVEMKTYAQNYIKFFADKC